MKTSNKNINLLLVLFFILSISGANAQELSFGIGGGIGTFNMQQCKELNNSVIQSLPFETKTTDNFPPYVSYNAQAIYSFPKILSLGVIASTTSTGSRVCLSDYSGSYLFDNIQNTLTTGINILIGTYPSNKNGICLSLQGGTQFSFLKLNENLTIGSTNQKNNRKLNAFGYYIQPGIDGIVHLSSRIMLDVNISYLKGFSSTYHLRNNKELKLYNTTTNEAIAPQWDGLRTSLTIHYSIVKFH